MLTEKGKIDNQIYTLKRSNRKSIGITIERDGSITVRAPSDLSFEEIEKFVRGKRMWIQQKLSERVLLHVGKPKREFVDGQGFLYLGKSYRLRYVTRTQRSESQDSLNGRGLRLTHGYFELDEKQKHEARTHFVAWYRRKTGEKLKERISRYDKRIGVQVEKFRVSNLGHRWASYSRNGVINFNWRSVMAPIWVFDYILVHEMVHMLERRHSKGFWRLIARVIPDYEEQVRWLNENGADLDL